MYALIIKENENVWEVLTKVDYSTSEERANRLSNAVDSGNPMTGMITTPFQCSATNGAIWDGTSFSGGLPCAVPPEISWEGLSTYAVLCENTIVAQWIITANPTLSAMYDAAFDDPNGVNMVRIPEGVSVAMGDIWDGQNFTSRP